MIIAIEKKQSDRERVWEEGCYLITIRTGLSEKVILSQKLEELRKEPWCDWSLGFPVRWSFKYKGLEIGVHELHLKMSKEFTISKEQ